MDRAKFLFSKNQQLFFNFLDHSTQEISAINYLTEKIPSMLSQSTIKKPTSFLDVGCGHGIKTLALIKKLKEFGEVETTVLDPSEELLDYFKKHSTETNIEYVLSDWESFKPQKMFELIVSIHTFYYIKEWKRSINRMLNALNDDGIICICIRSKGDVYKFKDHFLPKLNDRYKSERNYFELCTILDEMGFDYGGEIVESELDIMDILSMKEKGQMLIEFMLRKPYDDIPSEVRKEIIEYLKTHNKNGKLIHKDGFVWIKNFRK